MVSRNTVSGQRFLVLDHTRLGQADSARVTGCEISQGAWQAANRNSARTRACALVNAPILYRMATVSAYLNCSGFSGLNWVLFSFGSRDFYFVFTACATSVCNKLQTLWTCQCLSCEIVTVLFRPVYHSLCYLLSIHWTNIWSLYLHHILNFPYFGKVVKGTYSLYLRRMNFHRLCFVSKHTCLPTSVHLVTCHSGFACVHTTG